MDTDDSEPTGAGKDAGEKPGEKKPGPKKRARLIERAERLRAKLAKVERKLAGAPAGTAGSGGSSATTEMAEGGVSPFARPFPDLPEVRGARFAAAAAGVRHAGRKDVMLAELAPGTAIAGVFTRSATRSAPVDWCRARLAALAKRPLKGPIAIVANSGNANAFTGDNGMEGVAATAAAAAKAVRGAKGGVFTASTGVIGEALPAERITKHLADMAARLDAGAIRDAADAIMTTDTFAKGAGRELTLGGEKIAIAGIAKGSGMIAPDMATMLAFVFTDAPIARPLLQSMLSAATVVSFNAATVDSDTSTSDTLLVAATGKAGGKTIANRRDPRAAPFEAALREVLVDLAQQVVRDGEGISKYVAVKVTGAKTDASAAVIARAIANSPLVKTAIAGADPNWGRIVMAVGKSGEPANRDRLSIRLGDILVAEKGWVAPGYREEDGAAYMKRDEIEIGVDLGLRRGAAEVWTCDLTHRYIEINADYRS